MFTKNVNFELTYILTIGTVYWCHRGIMLNYFMVSGNWVKCLIKCRHSLVFPTLWNYVLYPMDISVRNTAHSVSVVPEGYHGHPLPHSLLPYDACLPLQIPCVRLPQPPVLVGNAFCLPSVSSSGATYSIELSSAFNQNHDANKCRQPQAHYFILQLR